MLNDEKSFIIYHFLCCIECGKMSNDAYVVIRARRVKYWLLSSGNPLRGGVV